jgi:hypothetical protein
MPEWGNIPTPLFGPGGGGNVASGLAGAFMALPGAIQSFTQQRRQQELDAERRRLEGIQTLADVLKLPGNLQGPMLDAIAKEYPIDKTLVATVKRSNDEQRDAMRSALIEAGASDSVATFGALGNYKDAAALLGPLLKQKEEQRRAAERTRILGPSAEPAGAEMPPPGAPPLGAPPLAAGPAAGPPALDIDPSIGPPGGVPGGGEAPEAGTLGALLQGAGVGQAPTPGPFAAPVGPLAPPGAPIAAPPLGAPVEPVAPRGAPIAPPPMGGPVPTGGPPVGPALAPAGAVPAEPDAVKGIRARMEKITARRNRMTDRVQRLHAAGLYTEADDKAFTQERTVLDKEYEQAEKDLDRATPNFEKPEQAYNPATGRNETYVIRKGDPTQTKIWVAEAPRPAPTPGGAADLVTQRRTLVDQEGPASPGVRALDRQIARLGEVAPASELEKDLRAAEDKHGVNSPEAEDLRRTIAARNRATQLDPAVKESTIAQHRAAADASRASADKARQERNQDAAKYTDVANLRKEFTDNSRTFVGARDAHGRVQAAERQDNLAGDTALIYGLAKLQAPGEAVMAGDYQSLATTPGIQGWVKQLAVENAQGRRLTPERRREMIGMARELFNEQAKHQRRTEGEYRGIARKRGFDAAEAVPDLGTPPEPPDLKDTGRMLRNTLKPPTR